MTALLRICRVPPVVTKAVEMTGASLMALNRINSTNVDGGSAYRSTPAAGACAARVEQSAMNAAKAAMNDRNMNFLPFDSGGEHRVRCCPLSSEIQAIDCG